MAYIYFQEGRWDKAIEEYKKLLALDPEDINTHNMLVLQTWIRIGRIVRFTPAGVVPLSGRESSLPGWNRLL
jgi:tetratricopeptide (TPR) repeat protein